MSFDPLDNNSDNVLSGYNAPGTNQSISISNDEMDKILAANLIFPRRQIEWYTKFNKFGCIDPFNSVTANREYLFFTKPDLNIFANSRDSSGGLISELEDFVLFNDAYKRYRPVLELLESSVNTDRPFNCLLSNAVTSKLDLPSLQANTDTVTPNIYGTTITYRGTSIKSDNAYDFSLSFTDTIFTEIYMFAKLYDKYINLCKLGYVSPKKTYIENRILPEQFSIYKFIVGDDGETILFACKFIGVCLTDVPRSDFSDPAQDGFKYSLSFTAQFVEDELPVVVKDFNIVAGQGNSAAKGTPQPVYDPFIGAVNNDWASYPYIEIADSKTRQSVGLGTYNYKLKWGN